MTEFVRGSLNDGVATITLVRPEAGNAMSWELVDVFTSTIEKLAKDQSVRAFLIRGEGKNFCVGGDIRSFAAETDPVDFIARLARRLHEGLTILAAHDAPVVVEAQGAAAGAGLSLVALGDIVVASEDASFSMAYTGIGLTADGGATWLLPRLIGLRATQEMAYLGRRLSAQDGVAMGLVTRLSSVESLSDDAFTIARAIADGPTRAFGGVKRLLQASDRTAFAAHLDAEADAIAAAMATADAGEGVASFLSRRIPVFNGR